MTGEIYWRPVNAVDQIKGIGNSVCPQDTRDLIETNAGKLIKLYRATAA